MKILQVALGVQHDIRDALASHGDVIYWDWSGKDKVFNTEFVALIEEYKPDVVFMQIQTPGIINAQAAKYASEKAYVVNWTGDVRYPTPRWFYDIGKQIQLTMFTNMVDVNNLKKEGINSDYLQIGFPTEIFKTEGEIRKEADIVFMGNNIGGFPLSDLRNAMVGYMANRFGKQFKAYGINWFGYSPENNQYEEAKIYRGAKIAINLSHFNYDRYSSDRLFRIMGTGVMCLSHHYEGIEQEFEIGVHLDVWKTLDELEDKINYYLKNEEKAKRIGLAGSEHVHKNHTWSNRMDYLFKKHIQNGIG